MVYELRLNDSQMANLLAIVRGDCESAYVDENAGNMAQDIDLLRVVAHSFKNEEAKLKLETIIAGYEKDMKEIS